MKAAPVPSPSPSPSPSPLPKLIQFSGFADAGYTSFTSNANAKFINGSNARVFDLYDKQPTLQNLDIQSVLTSGNFGGKVELSLGTDADIIAAYPAAFNGFDLTQAYLTYTAGKFALQGGKYVTLAGAEVIDSPSDTNYSRSILFGYAIPFTHTGARLTYAATPKLSVIAGVNAGWDVLHDTNKQKTAEYGLAWNPSNAFALAAQGYTGYEQLSGSSVPISGAQGQRTLLDLVATFKPTATWTFIANYDRGRQANASAFTENGATLANWSGIAGYANYQVSSRLLASGRYEVFKDTDGYRTGFAQRWREGTLTLAYSPSSAITFRGEVRGDKSDRSVFARTNSTAGFKNASSLGLEAIVKF
ncbi:MAG: hypothetical protein NVS2B17_26950 [Candidatus Velthaea sp.]